MSVNKVSLLYKSTIIFLSVCVISLPAYLFLFGQKDSKPIFLTTIVQKTSTLEPLSPRFFSDYLGLSPKGRSLLIKNLDIEKIQKKLIEFPIFKDVETEFTPQGELLVSYDLRRPLFILQDFQNCGVDSQGCVVPLEPFYSPKKLPLLYMGINAIKWNQSHEVKLALEILRYFDAYISDDFRIKMIDISRLQDAVPAKREVIVTIALAKNQHYLRLNTKILDKAIERYMLLFKEPKLKDQMIHDVIFDARIEKFATLKKINEPSLKK